MPKTKNETRTPVCCRLDDCTEKSPEFYKTYSELYSQTGYLPICKDCLKKTLNSYIEKYGDARKAMQRICMAFDLYYSDAIYESCCDKPETLLGNYIKMLNINQHRGKTFDTSLSEGFMFGLEPETTKSKAQENNSEPDPGDIEKWGYGLDPLDYQILNSHYNLLKAANPTGDSNQEIFINDLCYTKMQQMKAVREGNVDDYNKLTDSYRKSFKEAGLKTTRDSSVVEDFSLGITAETIEKYTPAEYYKNQGLYKDFDNIGEYIERFLLRPLRNLMHGSTDRDFEFYVKDEGGVDGYTDEE